MIKRVLLGSRNYVIAIEDTPRGVGLTLSMRKLNASSPGSSVASKSECVECTGKAMRSGMRAGCLQSACEQNDGAGAEQHARGLPPAVPVANDGLVGPARRFVGIDRPGGPLRQPVRVSLELESLGLPKENQRATRVRKVEAADALARKTLRP
jgi:hypothetical protein